jgi:chromosome segregation ATPase
MSSITLDLPTDVLEAAARLAQQRNVPRSEIFALAIGAWTRLEALEAELAEMRAGAERQAERVGELARNLEDARAGAARLAAELEEARRARDDGAAACRAFEAELGPLRASLEAAREETARLRQETAAAARRAAELEELDRKKVLTVMRDGEVAKLRNHGQELMVGVQKLEKDLEYQKMETSLARAKLETTARRVAATDRLRRGLETKVKKLEKDSFASEREIGVLLRDRARLREELRRLARIINRGLAGPPTPRRKAPAHPPRKADPS